MLDMPFMPTYRLRPLRISSQVILVIIGLWGLAACTTVSTRNEDPASGQVNGMLYYLPIGKITIVGEFKDLGEMKKPVPDSEKSKSGGDGGAGEEGTIKIAQLVVSITPEVEADEREGVCYATPQANYLFDDEVQVTVNAKHLLNTGNVTTEDKTVQIVAELVSDVADVTKGFSKPTPPTINRLPFHYSFHPSNRGERERVQQELADRNIGFTVEGVPTSDGKTEVVTGKNLKQLDKEGLLFRPAMSYRVRLTFYSADPSGKRDRVALLDNTQQFILPDVHRLYEMSYPRVAFVKRIKNVSFSEGMLTDYHQTTPSPIYGFLGIPKAIIKAVVPIPGD